MAAPDSPILRKFYGLFMVPVDDGPAASDEVILEMLRDLVRPSQEERDKVSAAPSLLVSDWLYYD